MPDQNIGDRNDSINFDLSTFASKLHIVKIKIPFPHKEDIVKLYKFCFNDFVLIHNFLLQFYVSQIQVITHVSQM